MLHAAVIRDDSNSAAIPPPYEGFVQTDDGVHLKYTQAGPLSGPPLVFIPGWRQTAAQWQKQVDYFSQNGYRVTAYDMRGHGDSEKVNFGYRLGRFGADLNNVLAQFDLRDVTIISHSMGCSVTWAFWDQFPDSRNRISKLVLVDQSAVLTADPHWTQAQVLEVSALFTPNGVYDLADNMHAQTPPFVRSMLTKDVSNATFDFFLAQNEKMSDANAATLVIDHAFRDWRDVLPRINVPAIVLAGELSVNKPAGIIWVASQIPGAKNYTFTAAEKGSHFAFWENPTRFNQIVEEFLNDKPIV